MTIQKAIDNIEEVLCSTVRWCDDSIAYELTTDDCDWIETAKSALEKQIPKKLLIDNRNIHYVNYKDFFCPYCRIRIISIISRIDGDFIIGKKQKHCDNCGQALDWSENNG